MQQKIKEIIQSSIQVKEQLVQNEALIKTIETCVDILVTAFKNGNKVLFCGNGGSAADAQHLAAEFSGRFYTDRDALPAEALHCNTSYITAVANDYSYDVIYSRMIKGIGNKGDVLIGLSSLFAVFAGLMNKLSNNDLFCLGIAANFWEVFGGRFRVGTITSLGSSVFLSGFGVSNINPV
jgi:hypothetical protein